MTYQPNYKWNLSDLKLVQKNGLKVFSCFACGGGSTMGYKLAGFDVIGANDIDPEMARHYKMNHNPKHYYLEDIRDFRKREDLPEELFDLDILDGSPPCSSFSMAGNREKDWSKEKVFREGQAQQTLDDLFFEFIALAKRLQPKVVIAENVKGMLAGNAKGYVVEVVKQFKEAGYDVQLFLLDGSLMGVPQKRERVFFVCRRKDLPFDKLTLNFNARPIPLGEALKGTLHTFGRDCSKRAMAKYWKICKPGKSLSTVHPKGHLFNYYKLSPNKPAPTITARYECFYRWDALHSLTNEQFCLIGSYPLDYKFEKEAGYMIGMSVPPLMTYGVANEVFKQWFATMNRKDKPNGKENNVNKTKKKNESRVAKKPKATVQKRRGS